MSRRDRRLWRFLDGRASREDVAALEEQARTRAALRSELEQGQALIEALEEVPYDATAVDLVGLAERRLDAPVPVARARVRWPWVLALGATAALAVAVVALRSTPEPAAPSLELVVLGVEGEAWVTQGGDRQPLKGGEHLRAGARLETAVAARASFGAQGALSVSLDDATTVEVVLLAGAETRLLASRGVVRARSEATAVQVLLGASGASATVQHGEISLLVSDTDAAVACTAGQAVVTRGPVQATLASGQELLARNGELGSPAPIHAALQLEVSPLPAVPAGVQQVRLSGQTSPGAEVTIDGVRIATDAQGRFTHELEVRPEMTHLVVRTRDLLERRREMQVAVHRRTVRPGTTPLETDWEWEKPKKG